MVRRPERQEPETWQHYALYKRVKEAIAALPGYFRTETFISGIGATDIHTLAGALGASIEDQVVSTLNKMRETWDPDGEYPHHRFMRQAQRQMPFLGQSQGDQDVRRLPVRRLSQGALQARREAGSSTTIRRCRYKGYTVKTKQMQVQDNGMHRTTIEIPEDIYLETVEAATKEGLKFSHVVRLALRDWLARRKESTP